VNARLVCAQFACAVAILMGTFGVAGCSSAEVSPIDTTLAASVDDPAELYTSVLAAHVRDGHVDYEALTTETRLDAFIAWLAVTDPSTLNDPASRLAFWINAYNAYTLKLIRDNYPVESINDLHAGGRIVGHVTKKTAWDVSFAIAGGTTYTLNHIEHEIIRPVFQDPRVHFALVCAAKSCPPLRSEAYDGGRLDEQLDDQARVFLAQTDKNYFETDKRIAHLSKILDWYRGDFADSNEELLRVIAPWLSDGVRESIESDASSWKVEHTDYDWNLNK